MFKKLKNLWNPVSDEDSSHQENKNETPQQQVTGSSIALRRDLIGKIVNDDFIQSLWDSDKITDIFVLWFTAVEFQIEVRKADFLNALKKALDDSELKAVSVASWIIESKTLPTSGKTDFRNIAEGIFLEIRNSAFNSSIESPKSVCSKAKISIVADSGTLVNKICHLDADIQKSYQIGRGVKDKTGRTNHIAISDNVEDVYYEHNRYVSSAHAQIVFIASKGFCLKSLNNQNRTIVYRNGNRVADIKDLYAISLPLQDDDRIELGKKVSLIFKIQQK